MSVGQIAILCVLAFLCLGGFGVAVIVGGTYLSGVKATWEDKDELR